MSQLEQRTNIKLCQKLGKTAKDKFQMMQQVSGDDTLSCSVVFDTDFCARERPFGG